MTSEGWYFLKSCRFVIGDAICVISRCVELVSLATVNFNVK